MRQTGDALVYVRNARLMKTSLRNVAAAIGILLAILGNRASASDDMLIFSSVTFVRDYDSLKKGTYVNNAWYCVTNGAVVNFSNSTPVHSGTYSMSVLMPPNSNFFFEHEAVDTTIYTNLTFWVNGGTNGGQQFTVYANLNGVHQPKLTNGPFAANTWSNVTISLSALGAAGVTNLTEIFFQPYPLSNNLPLFYIDDVSLVAAPAPAVVHVGVNATNWVRTVDARLFGLNTGAYDGELDNAETLSILNGMNIQTLRWPGGSYADNFHFNSGNLPAAAAFLNVVSNTQAQVFFTVNYGTGDTNEAVEWVNFCNKTNNCYCKYWEIGNESYIKSVVDDNTNMAYFGQEVAHDGWTYAMLFREYYNAMKAADTNIMIGAVAQPAGVDDHWNTNHPAVNLRTGDTNYGWTAVMLATMRTNGVTPDFLIEHKYGSPDSDTYNLLWPKTWTGDAMTQRQLLNDYLGTNASNVELVATEVGPPEGGKECISLVGGLFYCDSIGQAMQTEFNALMWWTLRGGEGTIPDPDNAVYGWRTNSAGIDVSDEGCVNDGNDAPPNRFPASYCLKLMQYFARGGDTNVTATNDYELLGTYAVRRTNGSLTLLVVNKSSTYNLTANINLQGFSIPSNSTILTYSYGMPQDNADETGIGSPDIAPGVLTGVSTNFAATFAPYSATVLVFAPATTWVGSATNGNWDIATTPNWNLSGTNVVFQNGSAVVFGDNAAASNIVITTNVSPVSTLVIDSALNYTFSGPGAISGGTLTKSGSGTLTILNTNLCNYLISAGTLQVGNGAGGGALGPGAVEVDATLAFNLTNNVTVTNVISGAGMVVQQNSNTLTLTGTNTYSGGTLVTDGTLMLGSSEALNNATGTVTVTNSGCLDFNNQQPTELACIISGAGFNGLGTLVQNSGQNNGYGPGSITLAGSATIGGSNQWNLSNGANTLNSPTNAYTLTKVGAGRFSLVNTTVSSNLGDITVLGGTFTYVFGTTGLGNPTNSLRLGAGTTLDLQSGAFPLNKVIVCSNTSTLYVDDGNSVISGPVTLDGGVINLAGGGTGLTFSNTITGLGGLSEATGVNVILAGTNTYTGNTTIQGSFKLIGNATVSSSANLTISSGGVMQVQDNASDGGGLLYLASSPSTGGLILTNNGTITAQSIIIGSAYANFSGRNDGTLTLVGGQTLQVNNGAAINGNVVAGAGSVVSPGGLGVIATTPVFTNALTFQSGSSNLMDISVSGTTNFDTIKVLGALTYGGTLQINRMGANGFSAGQKFKMFNAGSYSGGFAAVTPAPGAGLAWDASQLAVSGTLGVVQATNKITGAALNGSGGVTLTFAGSAGTTWRVQATTNLASPAWQDVSTNLIGSGGSWQFTQTNAANWPRRFYRTISP